jgi:hypothetical protein
MNKKIQVFLSIIMMIIFIDNSFAQTKLAQTGLKFLSVGADARASALGDAITSVEGNSSSMFYNPASMARQTNLMDATFNMTQWIADINYMHASASFAPSDGQYGVIGLSVASVDYGTFNRTIRDGGEAGYLDLGTYSPKAMALGVGYSKALSDKFAVGGNIRYVYQDLGGGHAVGLTQTAGEYKEESFDINVLTFDFGILYHTGFKSLNFGMSLRNFSQEIEYVEESFQLPLTFKIGLSMNLFDFLELNKYEHSFNFSIDASHPRDFKEQLHIGGEYTFYDLLSLRLGVVTPTDEQGINAGVGLHHELAGFRLAVDYAYLDFGIFENVQRFSISISY